MSNVQYDQNQAPPADGNYEAPAPVGYPTKDDGSTAPDPQNVSVETKSRGDGFLKGCCAAMCCCCALDACFG